MSATKNKIPQSPEVAVVSLYNEVYTKRDLAGVLALFAPDPDVVVINQCEE